MKTNLSSNIGLIKSTCVSLVLLLSKDDLPQFTPHPGRLQLEQSASTGLHATRWLGLHHLLLFTPCSLQCILELFLIFVAFFSFLGHILLWIPSLWTTGTYSWRGGNCRSKIFWLCLTCWLYIQRRCRMSLLLGLGYKHWLHRLHHRTWLTLTLSRGGSSFIRSPKARAWCCGCNRCVLFLCLLLVDKSLVTVK